MGTAGVSSEQKTQTLVITFGIEGNLCYLSHHETVSMLQRALIRAGVRLVYSQGFNPRPRLSLPLPRAVGVRSDCEMLCALVEAGRIRRIDPFPAGGASSGGVYSSDIRLTDTKTLFQPVAATYRISVSDLSADAKIQEAMSRLREDLAEHRPVEIERVSGANGPSRIRDVGPYLSTIEQGPTG